MSKIKQAQQRIAAAQPRPAPPAPPPPAPEVGPGKLAGVRARLARQAELAQHRPKPPLPLRGRGRIAAQRSGAEAEAELAAAVESLHGLTIAAKLERKAEFVERFRPQAEALLAANARNDLFTWWIVWLYDLGRIEEFIPQARAAIQLGWRTAFSSDLQTFLWDKVLEWSAQEFQAGRSPEPYFGQVYPAETSRMLEVVAAKYHKLAGDMAHRAAEEAGVRGDPAAQRAELEVALGRWRAAEEAYPKAGVKTRIADVKKELRRLVESAGPPTAGAGSGSGGGAAAAPPADPAPGAPPSVSAGAPPAGGAP